MILHDSDDFLVLSGEIYYELDAGIESRESILATILAEQRVSVQEGDILIDVIDYLVRAYGDKRRRLGPRS